MQGVNLRLPTMSFMQCRVLHESLEIGCRVYSTNHGLDLLMEFVCWLIWLSVFTLDKWQSTPESRRVVLIFGA